MTLSPEGPTSARLVLLLDAPGRWEHEYHRLCVGPAYNDRLLPWWRAVGLDRSDFYIDSVLPFDPVARGYHGHGMHDPAINHVPEHEMREAMDALHRRLASLDDPWLIVPLGDYGLYTLTGKGRVSWHTRDGKHLRPNLMSHRGSIYEYADQRGRRIKVIPTPHPMVVSDFHTPSMQWVCAMDWKRIAEDAKFRELRLPQQTHLISPSTSEALEYIRWTCQRAAELAAKGERLVMSIDVETPKKTEYGLKEGVSASTAPGTKCRMCGHTLRWHEDGRCAGPRKKGCTLCIVFSPPLLKPKRIKISEEPYLGCVGYAWTPDVSMTIPTTEAYWRSHDAGAWDRVRAAMVGLHADPNIDKVGQNFAFDMWWLARAGMPVEGGTIYDLRKMHNIQRPWSEWHDLAFQASLDTRQPYWKDEAKDPDSVAKYAHNNDALWTYNGIDNCVQRSLLDARLASLRDHGRLEYYLDIEQPVDVGLVSLSLTGIRADEAGRQAECARVRAEAQAIAPALNEAAGMPIVAVNKKGTITGKSPSPAKLKVFLYETLRLPAQYAKNAKKQKVVSTDVVTIKKLMERFPSLAALHTVGGLVLKMRRLVKVAGALSESKVSPDGRVYGLFKQDTGLGRLSCGASPSGPGANLQNQDRKLRQFYLPDL